MTGAYPIAILGTGIQPCAAVLARSLLLCSIPLIAGARQTTPSAVSIQLLPRCARMPHNDLDVPQHHRFRIDGTWTHLTIMKYMNPLESWCI